MHWSWGHFLATDLATFHCLFSSLAPGDLGTRLHDCSNTRGADTEEPPGSEPKDLMCSSNEQWSFDLTVYLLLSLLCSGLKCEPMVSNESNTFLSAVFVVVVVVHFADFFEFMWFLTFPSGVSILCLLSVGIIEDADPIFLTVLYATSTYFIYFHGFNCHLHLCSEFSNMNTNNSEVQAWYKNVYWRSESGSPLSSSNLTSLNQTSTYT